MTTEIPRGAGAHRPLGRREVTSVGVSTAITLLLNSSLWALLYFNGWVSGEEWGAMETVQALMLVLAAMIFALAIHKSGSRPKRLFFSALALLSITFLLRELEVEDYNLPALIIWLGSGAGRNIWIGGLWFFLGLALLLNRKTAWVIARQWLLSPGGILMALAGALLLTSVPFEKEWFEFSPATSLFWEEIQEMNGYLLLLLSACASLRQTRPARPVRG